jgi:hypothetical protein
MSAQAAPVIANVMAALAKSAFFMMSPLCFRPRLLTLLGAGQG